MPSLGEGDLRRQLLPGDQFDRECCSEDSHGGFGGGFGASINPNLRGRRSLSWTFDSFRGDDDEVAASNCFRNGEDFGDFSWLSNMAAIALTEARFVGDEELLNQCESASGGSQS